jgi:hypothetical protein
MRHVSPDDIGVCLQEDDFADPPFSQGQFDAAAEAAFEEQLLWDMEKEAAADEMPAAASQC